MKIVSKTSCSKVYTLRQLDWLHLTNRSMRKMNQHLQMQTIVAQRRMRAPLSKSESPTEKLENDKLEKMRQKAWKQNETIQHKQTKNGLICKAEREIYSMYTHHIPIITHLQTLSGSLHSCHQKQSAVPIF